MQQESGVAVRFIRVEDHAGWLRLYRGYREFYGMPHDPAVYDTVWDWLMDAAREERGLIADRDGDAVGLAHFRSFARPIVGASGMFLDDLFTDAAVRGSGVATAMLTRIAMIARDEGATVVRWITAEDNLVAQNLYDRVADRTSWITYDLLPAHGFQAMDLTRSREEEDDPAPSPASWCRNANREAFDALPSADPEL